MATSADGCQGDVRISRVGRTNPAQLRFFKSSVIDSCCSIERCMGAVSLT
jgi:hypothetical protein